jgi:2-polyprenyl-3-methyl-5-hydroxy-6-metoxy-1,4-benzoquinol methylase
MRIGTIPSNPIEKLLNAANILPTPLMETHMAMLLARTIMAGSALGIFAALKADRLTAEEIARKCGVNARAVGKLLNALVGARYLHFNRDNQRYSLATVSRKWLVPGAKKSVHDKMIAQLMEWDFIGQTESYVRSGNPIDFHRTMTSDQWGAYQRGQRAVAVVAAKEIARKTPLPPEARDMLDIGGSHGLFSVEICRRHPNLRAEILDLPEAVQQSAPLVAAEKMGDRVKHRVGNALTDNLGEAKWDLIFISQLVHHFDEPTNRQLAHRCARALRPCGILAIQEFVRPDKPGSGQVGALLDFYFALTSQAGTWSVREIQSWQEEAGLKTLPPIKFMTGPGVVQQSAFKPGPQPQTDAQAKN